MSNEYKDWLFDTASDMVLDLGVEKIESYQPYKNGWIFYGYKTNSKGERINISIKYTDEIDSYCMN